MLMPKFHEIMYPILDFIQDGQEYNVKDISDKIRDKYFNLSDEQKQEIVSNGYTRFHDRLMWARTYLNKPGLNFLNFCIIITKEDKKHDSKNQHRRNKQRRY